jgi:DNA modification methylase
MLREEEYRNKILLGDSLEVLKTLPDGIADMCVTSPPYYGLRDYGTGKWVGGDPNCNHKAAKIKTRFDYELSDEQQTNKGSDVPSCMKVCPNCGAVREDKQIGLEETPEEYIEKLVTVFHEVSRVLKDDGTLWVNIADSYCNSNGFARASDKFQRQGRNNAPANDRNLAYLHNDGYKTKDLIGIPWLLAFALRKDGWYLRQDIIWHKPNPMPESVKDRCTKSHEYVFLLSKQPHYYFDNEAIKEECVSETKNESIRFGGNKYGDNDDKKFSIYSGNEWSPTDKRNKRDVWSIPPANVKEAHFATMPEKLAEICILAGSRKGGIVLDPFFGSGTTGRVATKHYRDYIGIELNPEYIEMGKRRNTGVQYSLF